MEENKDYKKITDKIFLVDKPAESDIVNGPVFIEDHPLWRWL